MPATDLTPRLELALHAARSAGELILRHFHARSCSRLYERKGDGSPVTIADREAEQHIRAMIAEAFPHDAVLGEEFGEDRTPAPPDAGRWIIDPIDGTQSFVHGVPLFGTLIAYEQGGVADVGVIHHPALNHTVYAARGGGAWEILGDQPPRPARVSQVATPTDGVFVTTSPQLFAENHRWPAYQRLQSAFGLTRGWNDCYGITLVATGRADACVEPILGGVWDLAAVQPIIEESGGRLTDWHGRRTIHALETVITNGHLHDQTLALLRDRATS